jgi:hypothetical protein
MSSLLQNKTQIDNSLPEEVQRIVDAYRVLLADENNPFIMDESRLPVFKRKLKKALWMAIVASKTAEEKGNYKAAYLRLSSFLPDVGPEGIERMDPTGENTDELSRWTERMEQESRELEAELEVVEKKFGAHS